MLVYQRVSDMNRSNRQAHAHTHTSTRHTGIHAYMHTHNITLQCNSIHSTIRCDTMPYHTIHAYIDTCLRSWGDNLLLDRATWDQRNERAKDASATSSDAPLDHHGDSKLVASRKSNGATRTRSIHMWYCISVYILCIVDRHIVQMIYIKYVHIYIHTRMTHTHAYVYVYCIYVYM